MSTPSVPQATSSSASHEPELPGEPDSDKVYLGAVKSYNDRRGFGFVACAETAAEFGRDVYMSKLEAQLAAAGIALPTGENPQKALDLLNQKTASMAEKTSDKPGNVLRLAEEDIVCFMVKLSLEGFPQAVRVQKLQKFQGSIVRSTERDLGCADSRWIPGMLNSHEVASKFGGRGEVVLNQRACGQVMLVPGDRVTFCIPQELDADAPSEPLEAKLVMLASTARPAGSVLGCCCLHLPRHAGEGQSSPPPLVLDCHALGNKVILSGLPMDVGENELMRFFSKQGATKAIVAHARCCSFASINFPNLSEVCTLLGRSTHAFADDKETRIASIQDSRHGKSSSQDEARLPALPAPALTPGEEVASIIIAWAPLQLAVAYLIEIRPAGTKEAWAPVDTGTSAESEAGRFGADCSSCKVTGLRPGFAYEARISYFSSCSCRSEASEPSPAVTPGSEHQSISQEPYTPPPLHHAAYHQQPIWSAEHPAAGYCRQAPAPWRCAHGTVIPPPPPPEILAGDEAGFSVAVRWPSVGQASAYVVELREAGSSAAERFVRAADTVMPGSLVELRVGGLRPIPGRSYMAQVRAVAHCGCESAPSAEGYSPPMGWGMMSEGAMLSTGPGIMATTGSGVPPPPNWRPVPGGQPPVPPQGAPLHIPQAAPLHVPAGFAFGASGWPYSAPLPDASPISIPLALSFSPEGAQQQGTAEARLAAAVRTPELQVHSVFPLPATPPGELPMTAPAPGAPLTPPPQGPPAGMRKLESAFEKVAAQKELPPEITGQEECLILD